MAIRFFTLFVTISLAACGRSEPLPAELPPERDIPYRVLLTTFNDGAYADQPFHLLVKTAKASNGPKTVLRAEQCKNVSIAQTPDTLYVFYDELVLAGFTSIEFDNAEPVLLLCDMHAAECQTAQRRLAQAGLKLRNVCSYQTNGDS